MTVRVIRASRSDDQGGPSVSSPKTLNLPSEAARKIHAAACRQREEADRILDAARAEATRMLEEAAARVGTLEAEAQRRGLEAGPAEAAATLLRLAQSEQQRLDRTVPVVAAAVRAVAEKLVGERLEHNDAALLTWVRTAVERLRAARRVRVFASPRAIARLRPHVGSLSASLDQLVELRDATELDANTIRLESDLGEVTVELSTRVDLLVAALDEPLRDEVRGVLAAAADPTGRAPS